MSFLGAGKCALFCYCYINTVMFLFHIYYPYFVRSKWNIYYLKVLDKLLEWHSCLWMEVLASL